jgi:hypothetical protein
MSARNLLGGKGLPEREADNLTTDGKCGSLDVSQPYGPSWPVTGIVFLFKVCNHTKCDTVAVTSSILLVTAKLKLFPCLN